MCLKNFDSDDALLSGQDVLYSSVLTLWTMDTRSDKELTKSIDGLQVEREGGSQLQNVQSTEVHYGLVSLLVKRGHVYFQRSTVGGGDDSRATSVCSTAVRVKAKV